MSKTRSEIVAEAKRIREEIADIFAVAEHWNTCVRKPDEDVIDPDPEGQLARMAKGLDAMLAREAAL